MLNDKFRITLWGGWYGSHNIGDQALLITIAELLSKIVGGTKFVVLTNNPQHVEAYMREESSGEVEALHNRREFLKIVHRLATSNLFIFGGGVPFYENLDHVLVMALLVGIARTFRTPYMLWAVSSQEVKSAFAKRVFRWVLEGARAVTYRDEHTAELFRSCGFRGAMEHACDSGFWLNPSPDWEGIEVIERSKGSRDARRPLVALTPRNLISAKAAHHFRPKKMEQYEQELNCFAIAVDWCWENGFQPIFVPMHVFPPDDDRMAAYQIVKRARHGERALIVEEEIRPSVAPVMYGQCAFSLVARVHGSITSAIGGCPVGMYVFAPKHAGIMRAMGLEGYCIYEENVSPQTVTDLLERINSNREALRMMLAKKIESLKHCAIKPALFAKDILLNKLPSVK